MSTDVCGSKSTRARSGNFRCYCQRPGLKMCKENKTEACVTVCPSARLRPSPSLRFLSVLMKSFICYGVCDQALGVDRVLLTSHYGPRPLKALRHMALTPGANVPHCRSSCFPGSTNSHLLSALVSSCNVQQKHPWSSPWLAEALLHIQVPRGFPTRTVSPVSRALHK